MYKSKKCIVYKMVMYKSRTTKTHTRTTTTSYLRAKTSEL